MPPPTGRYDIYDDTGRSSHRSTARERERGSRRFNQDPFLSPRRRAERRSRAGEDGARERRGEYDEGLSLFEQFDRDMNIFQDSVFGGFFGGELDNNRRPSRESRNSFRNNRNSFFGDDILNERSSRSSRNSFLGGGGDILNERGNRNSFFGDMRPFGNNGGFSSSYMYESHTETMGPDGRVIRETVRSKPGADGRPETERIIHADGDTQRRTSRTRPIPNIFDDIFGANNNMWNTMYPMGTPPPIDNHVSIRDVTEEESEKEKERTSARDRFSRQTRRANRNEPRVTVQEPDEVDDGVYAKSNENSNGNSNGNSTRRSRRRSSGQDDAGGGQRKSFLDRARDWDWRGARHS